MSANKIYLPYSQETFQSLLNYSLNYTTNVLPISTNINNLVDSTIDASFNNLTIKLSKYPIDDYKIFVYFDDGTYIGDTTITGILTKITSENINNIVKITLYSLEDEITIPSSLFYNIPSLADVRFINCSNNVITLDSNSLVGCPGLTNLIIPSCINLINVNLSILSLTSLTIDDSNSSLYILSPHTTKGLFSDSIISNLYIGRDIEIPDGDGIISDCFKNLASDSSGINISKVSIGPKVKYENTIKTLNGLNIKELYWDCLLDGTTELSTLISDSFKKIIIGSNITTIPSNFFDGCENIEILSLGKVVTLSDDAGIASPKINYIKLPSTLKRIGKNCFRGSGLIDITIPLNVTYLGENLFSDCDKLKTIVIKNRSMINTPLNILRNCPSLQSIRIEYPTPTPITYISSDTALNSIYLNCHLDNPITTVFLGCTRSVRTIVLGPDVTDLNDKVFKDLDGVTSIVLGNNIKTLTGTAHFENCSSLTHITIPDGVLDIPSICFHNCSYLSEINFGNTRTTIPSVHETAFKIDPNMNLNTTRTFIVPNALYDEWITADGWSEIDKSRFEKYSENN